MAKYKITQTTPHNIQRSSWNVLGSSQWGCKMQLGVS